MSERLPRGIVERTLKGGAVVYGVRLAVDGRMQKFSPFKTVPQARAFYQKCKVEQREGRFFPEKYQAKGPPVQAFIDRYLPTIGQKRSAKGEQVKAHWWGVWYEGRSLAAITAGDLELARRALLEGVGQRYDRPRAPATVNRYMQWLHQVMHHPVNFAHVRGRNPVEAITHFKEVRAQRQTISPEQERRLILHLEQETPGISHAVRLAVMLGLRQSEEFSRRKAEIDTHHWVLTIPNAKHLSEPKVVSVVPSVRDDVRALLATPGPWLVPDPADPSRPFPISTWYKTKFRRACRKVGLPAGFNWHSFRHTFATRLLLSGSSTNTVAHAGGWKSERMVAQVYGHLSRSFVGDAVERAASYFGAVPGTATSKDLAVKIEVVDVLQPIEK